MILKHMCDGYIMLQIYGKISSLVKIISGVECQLVQDYAYGTSHPVQHLILVVKLNFERNSQKSAIFFFV
jgi:hypothetical protein